LTLFNIAFAGCDGVPDHSPSPREVAIESLIRVS
jgi:hypothetical protein